MGPATMDWYRARGLTQTQTKIATENTMFTTEGEPFTSETIELDLTDAELLVLFKMAHERDVSFNDFVEIVLTEYLEQITNDQILNKLDGTSNDGLVQSSWPYPDAN